MVTAAMHSNNSGKKIILSKPGMFDIMSNEEENNKDDDGDDGKFAEARNGSDLEQQP